MHLGHLKFIIAGSIAVLSLLPLNAQDVQYEEAIVTAITDTLQGGVGGVTVDRLGFIYSADFGERIRKITPFGEIEMLSQSMYGSSGNAVDSRGNLYQANFHGNLIRKIARDGTVTTFADEGLSGPVGIAIDKEDNLYVCNCNDNSLSKITRFGKVMSFAKSDLFNCPNGITFDSEGNLMVVSFNNSIVAKVSPDGAVKAFADTKSFNGHIALARGNFYVTGFRSNRIFKVTPEGESSVFAGTGAFGQKDGPASQAVFALPNGIAASPNGDRLYINEMLSDPRNPDNPRFSVVRQIKFTSLADRISQALNGGGVETAKVIYKEYKSDPATRTINTEQQINALGYQLMGARKMQEAIAIFTLNVESYPKSWNVYDSLGEAYMNAGNARKAIEHYEKSLEINPGNANGISMLERLGAR